MSQKLLKLCPRLKEPQGKILYVYGIYINEYTFNFISACTKDHGKHAFNFPIMNKGFYKFCFTIFTKTLWATLLVTQGTKGGASSNLLFSMD
jgi:hypothetical protein